MQAGPPNSVCPGLGEGRYMLLRRGQLTLPGVGLDVPAGSLGRKEVNRGRRWGRAFQVEGTEGAEVQAEGREGESPGQSRSCASEWEETGDRDGRGNLGHEEPGVS